MEGGDSLLQADCVGGAHLDEEDNLGAAVHFALPAVDGADRIDEVYACSEMVLYELEGKMLGVCTACESGERYGELGCNLRSGVQTGNLYGKVYGGCLLWFIGQSCGNRY